MMAFRSANMLAHSIKFNSAVSSDFLDYYENIVNQELLEESQTKKHQTFAPSHMRCDRISWFRLRGVQPDQIKEPDIGLSFAAQVGTACHEVIQERLSKSLGENWISVENWMNSNPELFQDYDVELNKKGYETLIDMKRPFPVRFACDGIVKFDNKVRLLEIKTSEFSSWNDLVEPKSIHIDQITCYSALLHIPDVLFLYQDRQYGGLKCFELSISLLDQQAVFDRMSKVLQLVEAHIAPDGLPIGDPWCSPSMCPYYKKCKEWGR